MHYENAIREDPCVLELGMVAWRNSSISHQARTKNSAEQRVLAAGERAFCSGKLFKVSILRNSVLSDFQLRS